MRYFLLLSILIISNSAISQELTVYKFSDEFDSVKIELDEKQRILYYYYFSDLWNGKGPHETCTYKLKRNRIVILTPKDGNMSKSELFFQKNKKTLVLKGGWRDYKLQIIESVDFETQGNP